MSFTLVDEGPATPVAIDASLPLGGVFTDVTVLSSDVAHQRDSEAQESGVGDLRPGGEMSGRKVLDEEEARACLEAQALSRLSPSRWAQENGYDGRSINAWRMNLKRRAAKVVQEFNLVELVPVDRGRRMPTDLDEVPKTVAAMTLRCGVFSVDVPATFDEALLTRVLRVMAAC